MLRIAMCDDSPAFMQSTGQLVRKWSEESKVPVDIFTFDNGDALIEKNMSLRMDIIFLDILMPMLNGMETAKELRQRDTAAKIIFLTSSPEFALESYEIKAQDYLLKPVTYEKIKKALDECVRALEFEPVHLVLKTDIGYQKLYLHDIEYIEAQNKRVLFYLREGHEIAVAEPLRAFEDKFAGSISFFKCHRSYLVYLPNVAHFNSSHVTTKSGRDIPIARGCTKAFKEAYFARMFQECNTGCL